MRGKHYINLTEIFKGKKTFGLVTDMEIKNVLLFCCLLYMYDIKTKL